jgi:hypothetical protein
LRRGDDSDGDVEKPARECLGFLGSDGGELRNPQRGSLIRCQGLTGPIVVEAARAFGNDERRGGHGEAGVEQSRRIRAHITNTKKTRNGRERIKLEAPL